MTELLDIAVLTENANKLDVLFQKMTNYGSSFALELRRQREAFDGDLYQPPNFGKWSFNRWLMTTTGISERVALQIIEVLDRTASAADRERDQARKRELAREREREAPPAPKPERKPKPTLAERLAAEVARRQAAPAEPADPQAPRHSLRARILVHFAAVGATGSTADEADAAIDLGFQAARRIHDLYRSGVIVDSGQKRKTRGGRLATVYVLAALKPNGAGAPQHAEKPGAP